MTPSRCEAIIGKAGDEQWLQRALTIYARAGMHEEAQKLLQNMAKVGLG